MIIIDGKTLAQKHLTQLQPQIKQLQNNKLVPCLVIVQVGSDLASNTYIKHKQAACAALGIKSKNIILPTTTPFTKLKQQIQDLNQDPTVDAILVQFPLPASMSKRTVAKLIDPTKDADGIHPCNQGQVTMDMPGFYPRPCTPMGVLALLAAYHIPLKNRHIVVVGRSNITGRPMSNLLINENATVSLIHTHTPPHQKALLLKSADIIITATGSQDVFGPADVKQGVVIVDIGIIYDQNGKMRGDIAYRAFANVASHITPVPGGVGPMTVAMLMTNVVQIATNKLKQSRK